MSPTNQENDKTYEQIRQEHADLREHLGVIHRILVERRLSPAEVAENCRQLRQELVEHFQDEEERGFFRDVIERAPRYSERVEQLCQEHVQFLEMLDQVASDAESGAATSEWWEGLTERFHDFSQQLMHHETQENELLQNAYGIDIGAND